ncbi:hypothetical protein [Variovorax sp. Sphag1AA]|uniref:hypothetical protein n=1 Tax=Variovorax sp. Sphag1AA TaxID=2587027 RepID=UPI00161F4202|nr:hypothetical protein [Variovorax sp. Sphag1AA]MBB3179734.1 hypothetical protein [Variovorax sp. Sphag1AA]
MSPDDTGDLHDPRLWRALEHAPDRSVAPDWRVRKEILKQAHAAIGEPDPEDAEADLERAAQSWWHRLGEGRGVRERPRRRWPAAVAVAMVAFVAVMLWRREPALPSAPSIDDKTAVAANSTRIEELTPAPAASRPPPTDPSSVPLLPPSFFTPPKLPEPAPEAEPQSAPNREPVPPPKKTAAMAPATPSAPAQAVPPPSPQKAQKTPQPTSPPLPPAAPQQQREATASVKQPPAVAEAPSPAPTAEIELPTFDALGKWNRMTISKRGGESRSLARAEAGDVSPLLNSAALSAVGPQPFKGTPEWRVTLERGPEVLAVLEVSGSQIRWREGHVPAATGVPSAGAISALRDALGHAVQQPKAAPSEPPMEPPGEQPSESAGEPPRSP